ncbi:MAG: Head fiber protein [Eubacteriales bacterium]|nr:Head fiber protein [Eubacteriales bacterium]
MSYNAKNYTEQGGEKTVIGGTLEILEGASVTGLPSSFTPAANQADSTATTIALLKDDFNALLAKLKTAGLMEADTETE